MEEECNLLWVLNGVEIGTTSCRNNWYTAGSVLGPTLFALFINNSNNSLPADVLWGSFVTPSFLPHVGEKWTRDKRTPKDVCGKATATTTTVYFCQFGVSVYVCWGYVNILHWTVCRFSYRPIKQSFVASRQKVLGKSIDTTSRKKRRFDNQQESY